MKNVLDHDLRVMELHAAYDIELNITPWIGLTTHMY